MTLGPLGEGDSCHIAKLDLANFSTASYGDSVGHSLFAKHKHMLRRLVSTKSLSGPGTQIVIGRSGLTGGDQDKGTHHFSVFLVGDADDRSQFDVGMGGKSLFNLERVDVFAAYDGVS